MNSLENPKENSQEKIKLTPEMMEKSFIKLNGITAEMATEMKSSVFDGKKMIDQEGHIKMSMFDDVLGKENIKKDNEHIDKKKKLWAGIGDERRMEDWKNRRGLTDEAKIIKQYEEDRNKSKPALLESAVTILFHKILKDRFLVVKSSEWDDYENGADNIIIDKETGEIVGMFDEVGGDVSGEEKERGEKKDKEFKIIEKAQRGGAKIKYGLTFEKDEAGNKKLVKKSFENIPIFYLSLKLEDLGDLINSVGENLNDGVGEKGLEFFDNFIKSLEAQSILLQEKLSDKLEEGKINKAEEDKINKVNENIENFKKSLVEMKKLREKN